MKKYIISILLLILSLGCLIYAIVVTNTLVMNSFVYDNHSIFDNGSYDEFVLYDNTEIADVDALLQHSLGDNYVGITYSINIYQGSATTNNIAHDTNIFLATESVVTSYKFWTLSSGEDLTLNTFSGCIPIIVYGADYQNTTVGTIINVELYNASGENYIADCIVVGVASAVTQIPEAVNFSAVDLASLQESFIIMPELDDLSYLRYNRYTILETMYNVNIFAFLNLFEDNTTIYPNELYEFGYFVSNENLILIPNYFYYVFGTYWFIAGAMLATIICICVIVGEIIYDIAKKRGKLRTKGGANYDRI